MTSEGRRALIGSDRRIVGRPEGNLLWGRSQSEHGVFASLQPTAGKVAYETCAPRSPFTAELSVWWKLRVSLIPLHFVT